MSDNFEISRSWSKTSRRGQDNCRDFPRAAQRISARRRTIQSSTLRTGVTSRRNCAASLPSTRPSSFRLSSPSRRMSPSSHSRRNVRAVHQPRKEAYQPIETNLTRATDLAKAQVEAVTDAATKAPFKSGANAVNFIGEQAEYAFWNARYFSGRLFYMAGHGNAPSIDALRSVDSYLNHRIVVARATMAK